MSRLQIWKCSFINNLYKTNKKNYFAFRRVVVICIVVFNLSLFIYNCIVFTQVA